MKEIQVVKILGKPRETYMNIDNLTIEYWSVPVVMNGGGVTYESSVTFTTRKDAENLNVGETFYR